MSYSIEIKIKDRKNNQISFNMNNPTSVSRKILYKGEFESSSAFYLPGLQSIPFTNKSGFIGAINKGGSCNVNVLTFSPHSLTHIETSSHVTTDHELTASVKDLEPEILNGPVYLLDCTAETAIENNFINWEFVKEKLDNLSYIPEILALKTKSSQFPENYNFSGKNFISLGQKASRFLSEEYPVIKLLILDLPSADNETETILMGHKEFLLLNKENNDLIFKSPKAIVELAHFGILNQGYYFCMLTPTKIETDAMITDILFWNLEKKI